METEIKFRAWDKEEREMIYPNNDGYQYDNEAILIGFDGELYTMGDDGGCGDPECCGGTGYNIYKAEVNFILMQYTGLKDRNGKEIYEGDIVKDGGNLIFEVFWSKKSCAFKAKYPDNKISLWNIESLFAKDFEVIGNIYENPEKRENINDTKSN